MGSKPRPVPDSRTETLLKSSESFLNTQNFEECRKQALRAQESDPTHPGPAQLIAIADVIAAFSATISAAAGSIKKSDYYSIIGVPRFTVDLDLIKTHYEKLAALLNPNENPYDLSKQAFSLVNKAWRVLSDPTRKAEFDEELGLKLKSVLSDPARKPDSDSDLTSGNGSENRSFWTVCTYCYYLYEYPDEYEKCCMRCQNDKCRRAFNAVACYAPPPEVIAKGTYDCLEGMPFYEKHTNGGKFVGTKKQKMAAKSTKKLMGKGVRVKESDYIQL